MRKQEASPKPVKPETLSHPTICEAKANSKVVGCAATNRVEGVGVKPGQAQEEIHLWPPAPLAGAQRYRAEQGVTRRWYVPAFISSGSRCSPGSLDEATQLSVNLQPVVSKENAAVS